MTGCVHAGADGAPGVVARPLAERPFLPGFLRRRRDLPLDGDLGAGGNRQARHRAADVFHGPAHETAHHLVLRAPPGELRVGGHEHQRVLPEGGHRGAALALLPVAHADEPPLLPRAHPQPQQVAVVKLHPVGAGIDVVAVGVGVHQAVGGAEVAPPVVLVEARRGELEQVHVGAREDVLHHRRRIHFLRRQRLGRLHLARRQPQQLQLGQVGGEPQRHRHALVGGIGQAQQPVALGIVLDVVEDQHRRLRDQLGRRLDDGADLPVPVGAVHVAPLADFLGLLDEAPQVVVDRVSRSHENPRFRFLPDIGTGRFLPASAALTPAPPTPPR